MDLISSNSMMMMQRSLEFLWQKQSCILDNIANVETPGYKVKYATFEESLRDAVLRATGEAAPVSQVRQAIQSTPVVVREAQESARLDENGVNITEQSVELARNGIQQQYVMSLISQDFNTLRTAIRG